MDGYKKDEEGEREKKRRRKNRNEDIIIMEMVGEKERQNLVYPEGNRFIEYSRSSWRFLWKSFAPPPEI